MSILLRLGIGGLIVGFALWLRGGAGDVAAALSAAGWLGIVAVSLFHAVPMSLCGLAWRTALPERMSGGALTFVLARWVRDGVGQLFPFMPLGGEVVAARVLTTRGLAGSTAAALTVVDITAEVLSQAVFSLIGVAMWLHRHPAGMVMGPAGIGVALSLPMLGGLLLAQRLGMVRLLEKLADRVMPDAWRTPGLSAPIHERIVAIYAERRRFLAATSIHLVAWIVATGEAWLALHLIGHPKGIGDVLAMESVVYAIRNAAFLIPGALGVQEGAYMLVGAAIGLPPDVALAVSLIKRGREVTLGTPALVTWQWLGRRAKARAVG
ncbi:MAG: lysylphosphatidylglycerol synthase domain-containing protein [Magnetospirillum sp.]|nr:lysylphosphatidylglycerol synthase domain-containing protein [Magnetospirillum sp.]